MEPSEFAGQPEGGTDRRWDTEPETAAARAAGPGGPTRDQPGAEVQGGDLGVLGQIEAELADVERALERLDEGTYGACELCGRPIGAERLETMPATRVCTAHARTVRGGPLPGAG